MIRAEVAITDEEQGTVEHVVGVVTSHVLECLDVTTYSDQDPVVLPPNELRLDIQIRTRTVTIPGPPGPPPIRGVLAAIDLIEELVEDTPCSVDHHGYCQQHHGGFREEADGSLVCWNVAARRFLGMPPLGTTQPSL